jgi:LytS/YehU family sensor histidine kinase
MFFYLNAYFLIPRYFLQKKYIPYFLFLIALLSIFLAIPLLSPQPLLMIRRISPETFAPLFQSNNEWLLHSQVNFVPPVTRPANLMFVFLFLMIWGLSTAIRIALQWSISENKAAAAETARLHAELSFLKAQINPHFLFNTLNNIYTLALIKSDKASDAVMGLSKMMRYITEESDTDYVPLQNEVQCIQDYIDLQKIRLNETARIHYSVSGDIENKRIAPLLLVPFVENAFQYGISNHEESPVLIHLSVKENNINFKIKNKIFNHKIQNTNRRGIGLANVKKRLNHLYTDRYILKVNNENNIFQVELILKA